MGQEIILTHSQIHQDVQEMLYLHIHLLIPTLLLRFKTLQYSSGGSNYQYCSNSLPTSGGYSYKFKVTDSYGDGWDGYLQIGTRTGGSVIFSLHHIDSFNVKYI